MDGRLEARIPWTCHRSARAKEARRAKARAKVTSQRNRRSASTAGSPARTRTSAGNFSAALRKKPVQPDKTGRYAGVEVDTGTGKRKPSGVKGTGAVSFASERMPASSTKTEDAYLFPLPIVDESNDSTEDLMALSRQVLFDVGAATSVCPSTFRPDVPIEPPEEIPLHQADCTRVAHFGSKFLSIGVGTQKIEGRFDVRHVTKSVVAAGQVTYRDHGVWLNSDGGFILDVKSARKIEKLL